MLASLANRLFLRSGRVLALLLAAGLFPPPLWGGASVGGDADAETKRSTANASTTKAAEIRAIYDIPYYTGKDADPIKHRLDLFLPKSEKNFPVLFFVHGGAWRNGDKNFFGMYTKMATFWASHGIGAVIVNYRLSPGVTHPEHIKDVARAFAWTYRNIAKYGGAPDKLFVIGHSAGGHLISLLATDETYLKAEGLGINAIRGAIPMSGVFHLPANDRFLESMFGTDAQERIAASPLSHVRRDAPPFLIIYADHDLSLCSKEYGEEFCRALRSKNCAARTLEVKDRNHSTLFLFSRSENDPAGEAILQFVREHTKQ